jgi:uncharacterized membrane protein YtjA (UPF0391 family)
MLVYAIVLFVVAIIAWALSRHGIGNPITSLTAMIAGGIGLLCLVIWLLAVLTHGNPDITVAR